MCTGEWESRSLESFALVILYRQRANKVFGKHQARLLKGLYHGSSSIQVRRYGESSFVTPSAALCLQDNLRSIIAIRLPEGKISIHALFFYSLLIMFCEIMIMLCLITSMIELFMLDLIMLMIYLFQNLVMQLPNISTQKSPRPQRQDQS